MDKLKWSDDLSVGVSEIDEQHKKEVEILNRLIDNLKDRDKAGPILHELAAHTKMHFETEERYFDSFGFDQSKIHKKTHNRFLEQAARLVADFDQGNDLDEDHIAFVARWLVNHIRLMDKKYTKCFNENGLV